ncbi:hypothetical protein A8924_0921 [Saccharopolyspora erythraea NRRL 2338]|nr:hypothetical protein A8924_0921 [Saccharopolyspora erythraea NRRL 2338]
MTTRQCEAGALVSWKPPAGLTPRTNRHIGTCRAHDTPTRIGQFRRPGVPLPCVRQSSYRIRREQPRTRHHVRRTHAAPYTPARVGPLAPRRVQRPACHVPDAKCVRHPSCFPTHPPASCPTPSWPMPNDPACPTPNTRRVRCRTPRRVQRPKSETGACRSVVPATGMACAALVTPTGEVAHIRWSGGCVRSTSPPVAGRLGASAMLYRRHGGPCAVGGGQACPSHHDLRRRGVVPR